MFVLVLANLGSSVSNLSSKVRCSRNGRLYCQSKLNFRFVSFSEANPFAQLLITKKLQFIEDAYPNSKNQLFRSNLLWNEMSDVVTLMISTHGEGDPLRQRAVGFAGWLREEAVGLRHRGEAPKDRVLIVSRELLAATAC